MEWDHLLGPSKLWSADEDRDLGVIIDKSLKPSKHCMKAANAVLGMINKTLICKNKDLVLYVTYADIQ